MHIASSGTAEQAERQASSPANLAPSGPLAQSVALAFRLITAVTLLLALAWVCGNIRQVPPDSSAVVERFGRVSRVRNSGLLLAWPPPFEQVRLLPSADRQIVLPVAAEATPYSTDETDLQLEPNDDVIHMEQDRDAANASYLLTGDSNVVRLDASVYFHIVGPAAYVLAEAHVHPALRRLFLASAVTLAASHRLDDFLVAQPDAAAGADPLLVARRGMLRGALVASINARLATMRAAGSDLGVEATRIDLVALLPPRAKAAFDEVLTATQIADQNVAAARTDAARTLQEADRGRDRLLADADAAASERLRAAATDVAPVAGLEASLADRPPAQRDAIVLQAWRDRVAAILQHAGEVTAVDARAGNRAILPGPGSGVGQSYGQGSAP